MPRTFGRTGKRSGASGETGRSVAVAKAFEPYREKAYWGAAGVGAAGFGAAGVVAGVVVEGWVTTGLGAAAWVLMQHEHRVLFWET